MFLTSRYKYRRCVRRTVTRVYSGAVIAVVVILLSGLLIGPAVTASHSGISGTIVVGPDETVSDIDAVAGTIHVQGTVTGDISGFAGTVIIDGTVQGNVDIAAGNVEVRGTVMGDLSVASGNVQLHEGSVVGGELLASAGLVTLNGQIGGAAQVVGETIELGEEASLESSLVYNGNLVGNTDAVAGEITRDTTLGVGEINELQPFVSWFFIFSIFVLNLLYGVVLLGLFPRFSGEVISAVRGQPARMALVGLVGMIAIPVVLLLIALTVIGLPITVVGVFVFLLVMWAGLLYGRIALGVWLLSFAGITNRWLGLFLGLLIGTLLWEVPYFGGLANFVILLLGIGALLSTLVRRRRRMQRVGSDDYPY